jgi:RNA polymerase sigma factor (sigma-70 family)
LGKAAMDGDGPVAGSFAVRNGPNCAQTEFMGKPDADKDGRTDTPMAARAFVTTQWSKVLMAGQGDSPAATDALAGLCRTYWYPLYVYVGRQGRSPQDAQDLTQEFFARLLEKRLVALADPERGRFRTFLLTALKHFLANEWEKAHAVRRGGRCTFLSLEQEQAAERFLAEPADDVSPEKAYEQRWAAALLEAVLQHLRQEAEAGNRAMLFEKLKDYLWGEAGAATYASIASELGLSETAVKVAAHRLRQRFREVLRAEIARTVSREEEIDDELRHLFSIVSE